MTLPVTFHRAARAEFINATAWYESKRPGLGDELIAEIERCVTLIATQPRLYTEVHNRIRRFTVRWNPRLGTLIPVAIFLD